ncbi:hypothetical protein KP509_11G021600 [Ceratopteris richardii]|uniref:B box-type domain-containing protein n=1 Tax=Ceratopteris richardii TaxID=49495 RepID=A0A8T2TSK4_CERRI|nr:hypothetical protein KP509_11G021600 [Ceratopteris richardii]KAH7424726.1 hypothetical protein KP509_11G021600 [Ceratopteris richardii]
MRAVCDVCETAPAVLFCAADEAALCIECDEKVHGCNKLASRHIRLTLADEPNASRKCDICENATAFFFCAIDGTSLCLQCDLVVHVGGKMTHERCLLMGQRVELPMMQAEGRLGKPHNIDPKAKGKINRNAYLHVNHQPTNSIHSQQQADTSNTSAIAIAIGDTSSQMIDLNFGSRHELSSTVRDAQLENGENEESLAVVPDIARREASSSETLPETGGHHQQLQPRC